MEKNGWDEPQREEPRLALDCEIFRLTEAGAAHWLAMDGWTLEEAALLLAGANPKRISEFDKDPLVSKPDFDSCGYVGIFDRLCRAKEMNVLTFPAAPTDLLAWAAKKQGLPSPLATNQMPGLTEAEFLAHARVVALEEMRKKAGSGNWALDRMKQLLDKDTARPTEPKPGLVEWQSRPDQPEHLRKLAESLGLAPASWTTPIEPAPLGEPPPRPEIPKTLTKVRGVPAPSRDTGASVPRESDAPLEATSAPIPVVAAVPGAIPMTHRLKTRTNPLASVFKKAKEAATNPVDAHSVWASLFALAASENPPPELTDYCENKGIQATGVRGGWLSKEAFMDRWRRGNV